MTVYVNTRSGETLTFSSTEVDDLYAACEDAFKHVEELRGAWERGCISEHDGKGGTRSSRNVEVEIILLRALRGKLNAGRNGRSKR